jgi:hypothetical protein
MPGYFESDFFFFKWNGVSFKHGNALTINILQQEIESVKEALPNCFYYNNSITYIGYHFRNFEVHRESNYYK